MILGGKELRAKMLIEGKTMTLMMLMGEKWGGEELKQIWPSLGYSKKMSILYLSPKNQSYLAVIVENEPVGNAVGGLTIVEFGDG